VLEKNGTRAIQLKLLELIKVLHEVCTKNDIKYFIVGGTMLGAIRHHGFIPWDDDMDIGLPRNDYEKLISLPKSEWPDFIHIKTPRNSEDLIFPYAKLMNKNTTLVESKLDGIVGGVYVDIFPIDGVGNSDFQAKINYYKVYKELVLLYYNQYHGTQTSLLKRIVQLYARKQNLNKLYNSLDRCLKNIKYEKNQLVGNLVGAWGMKEVMPKDYFGKPTLYPFEDISLYGPEKADLYLKTLYGNYLQLPPLEKQKSHHKFEYINLNKPYKEYIKDRKNVNIYTNV
jgi:lipopolysaccharide cholinephosphotransferase